MFAALAPEFATRKLEAIAQLEQATPIVPETVVVAPRPRPRLVADPLHLEIAFEDGLPISINGVPMTLTELIESIETITGEPALDVLDREIARVRDVQPA